MPRKIDHEQRRQEIIRVTKDLIAERGLNGVSFREIGRRLGGSTTLATHYYASLDDLYRDIAVAALERWQADLRRIEKRYPDPAQRLNVILFEWILPLTGKELIDERARINLVAAELQGQRTQEVLDMWEAGVKDVLRPALRPFVPEERLEDYADALRAAFNGVALSTVEHPDHWSPRRQKVVFEALVEGLGLPIVPTKPRLTEPATPATTGRRR